MDRWRWVRFLRTFLSKHLPQSNFKPIYYLGNKSDFIQPIKAAIEAVDPKRGAVGDVFAGTGSVAAALIHERPVVTCDVQEYSRVLCSAVLTPKLEPKHCSSIVAEIDGPFLSRLLACLEPLAKWEEDGLASESPQRIAELLESPTLATREQQAGSNAYEAAAKASEKRLRDAGLWESPETTVSRLYAGVYFSFRQAAVLDAALRVGNLSEHENFRDSLVAAALSTASSVVNTVGKHFAQPIRPRSKNGEVKTGLPKVVARDRSIDALKAYQIWLHRYASLDRPSHAKATVIRGDFQDILTAHGHEMAVVYADPPYTRDHYSRFYHVLETMCLRDNPSFSSVTREGYTSVSRGLYRADRFQSDFCVRSLAPSAFDKLFRTARDQDSAVVLSYSPHERGDGTHPRVVSQEQILSIARQYYPKLEVQYIDGSTHNVLNSSALRLKGREHAELILKCYR